MRTPARQPLPYHSPAEGPDELREGGGAVHPRPEQRRDARNPQGRSGTRGRRGGARGVGRVVAKAAVLHAALHRDDVAQLQWEGGRRRLGTEQALAYLYLFTV